MPLIRHKAILDEERVGAAIEKTGVDRKDIFLTTKVWIQHYGYEKAKLLGLDSMEKLVQIILIFACCISRIGLYGAWRAL